MSQNLPDRSLRDFLSLRHPNHFVLAGANNRNVIITYRFLAASVQANRDFFCIDCMTVYFNCRYYYTRELLESLLGISPSGRNPCGGNYCRMISVVLCKVSQPSRWKQKSYDGKSVISQCSCIIDGATLRLSVFVWTVLFFCPSEEIKHVQELSVDNAIC